MFSYCAAVKVRVLVHIIDANIVSVSVRCSFNCIGKFPLKFTCKISVSCHEVIFISQPRMVKKIGQVRRLLHTGTVQYSSKKYHTIPYARKTARTSQQSYYSMICWLRRR